MQALWMDFEIHHMKEGETVNAFLISMISKFDYVVWFIEESNNLDTMIIDELQSNLLVHEQRMKSHGEEEQVLKISCEDITVRGRGRVVFRGGWRRRRLQQPYKKSCYRVFLVSSVRTLSI